MREDIGNTPDKPFNWNPVPHDEALFMPETFDHLIVKRFPKGYIVFSNHLERRGMPRPGWTIVEHFGKNEDGLEVFIQLTGKIWDTIQDGIWELKKLRGY